MLEILWPGQAQYLCLDELTLTPSALHLRVSVTAPSACCPVCQRESTHVHSHYLRSLWDLPVACLAVHLHLRVRRFFCDARDCPRRTFVERLAALMQPYAHRTTRLAA